MKTEDLLTDSRSSKQVCETPKKQLFKPVEENKNATPSSKAKAQSKVMVNYFAKPKLEEKKAEEQAALLEVTVAPVEQPVQQLTEA